MVHPDKLFTKGGAQVGDHLILTKPLGVGIVNTAMKQGKAKAEDIQAAMQTMATLNKTAAQIAQNYPVHASSDITGFSLMGHAYEMASQSGHDFCINYADLHWVPGVDEYAALGIFPGGMGRNRAYYSQWAEVNPDLANDSSVLGRLYDPQTSGGLLLAVEPEASRALLSAFKLAGVDSRGIGSVEAGSGRVRVA
jgi:selenide,water dikinase